MDPIDPNKPIRSLNDRKTARDFQKPGQPSFDALFKQRLESGPLKPSAPESPLPTEAIRPAQFTIEPTASGKIVVDQLQRLVDTMEMYHSKLDQAGTALKEIAPLVERMDSQSRSLVAVSGTGDDQSATLQEMVDQSLMLATLEISRFRSGYYNP